MGRPKPSFHRDPFLDRELRKIERALYQQLFHRMRNLFFRMGYAKGYEDAKKDEP